jgi:polyadenylate-binding protein
MERHEVEEVSNEVEERQDLRFKVFVGGLDKYAKEEDLRKVFGGVEEVTKVRLSWDSESKKRVAFLTFATFELARRAICEISDPVVWFSSIFYCVCFHLTSSMCLFIKTVNPKWI